MKYILIATGLLFGTANLNAQIVGTGQRTGGATSPSSNTTSGKGSTSAGKNIPQSHGSRDLTPGSPVGTGGACIYRFGRWIKELNILQYFFQ